MQRFTAIVCALGLMACAIAAPAAAQDARGIEPLRRHGIDLPAKPPYEHTLYVCQQAEVRDCYPTPSAAIVAAPSANARILIFCGTYERDAAKLTGRRNLVLEGVPCPDGRLPVLDAQGAQQLGMGPYPWVGATEAWALWVEKLELRGARVKDGDGTPIHVGGNGPVVFYNVIFRDNENGILVSPSFNGTLYVVDSVFRDNGYGTPLLTHHLNNACSGACATVVLDSYFGRVRRGGSHIRVRGDIVAIGNVFVDEPGSYASRMISIGPDACRMQPASPEPPCLIARNYMLKGKSSPHADFISIGEPRAAPAGAAGLVVRDNVALGLRFRSVLIGTLSESAQVTVRDNVMVVQDREIWCADAAECLLGRAGAGGTLVGNVVSDDPTDLPTEFPNLRGLGPGH